MSTIIIPSYVVVPPSVEPITVEQAKRVHRVLYDIEDADIADLIQSAREAAEHYLGQSLVTQTREVGLSSYVEGMTLPYGPVQSVLTVGTDDPVIVQYVAGYPPVAESDPVNYVGNIPKSIIRAMHLLIGDGIEHREQSIVGGAFDSLPLGVQWHLNWHRARRGFG